MSSLKIDRLLETMFRRKCSELVMTSGTPPTVLIDDRWTELQAKTVDAEDLFRISHDLVPENPVWDQRGFTVTDFSYGILMKFRLLAFDYPNTTKIHIIRLDDENHIALESDPTPPSLKVSQPTPSA